jgi:hypothetical protein
MRFIFFFYSFYGKLILARINIQWIMIRIVTHLKALTVSQSIRRPVIGWLMNYELEAMCKDVVVACFYVLCQHLPRGTEESQNVTGPNSLHGTHKGLNKLIRQGHAYFKHFDRFRRNLNSQLLLYLLFIIGSVILRSHSTFPIFPLHWPMFTFWWGMSYAPLEGLPPRRGERA